MEDLELITRKVNEIFAPHEVWAVGGCVRDSIIGRTPKDFDFATSLNPDEIESMIKAAGRHANPRGKRFGTLGFKIEIQPKKFMEVEVTSFRQEQYTKPGGRHPEVQFVADLQEDLSRRDFTMNAVAYRNGEFFDPFGGRLDIMQKKIKGVGEVTDRFKDDPLRMLRAARFAAQLEFTIDPNMIGKIRKMPEKILTISRERWMQELDKLLVQDRADFGLEMLQTTYLMKYMLPEVHLLHSQPPESDIAFATSYHIAHVPKEPMDRWVELLRNIGRPYVESKVTSNGRVLWTGQHLISAELSKGIARRLKWSNDYYDYIIDKLESVKD